MIRSVAIFACICFAFVVGCGDDDGMGPGPDPVDDLTDIPYDPVPYEQIIPEGFPQMIHPDDNPQTIEGVQLGRRLFFDPILSSDSTISCASCHLPRLSFTDARPIGIGVNNARGTRSSMSLINVGFHNKGFFWDGRVTSLEEQALHPVEDPMEMNNTWEEVERRLREHHDYPERFRKAFGIDSRDQITRDLTVKAIAQFERILVSSGNSRYDRALRGEVFFTDEEQNGFDIFFDTTQDLPDAECGHCHTGPLLTTNEFINNGLDEVESLDEYTDLGRGAITSVRSDNGKFKVPTLRNITLTAPYMHDGRFGTLEEVIEHYDSGGHHIPNPDEDNVSNFILELRLTDQHKAELMAFLKTLEDDAFVENPDISNPFK